MDHAPMSCNTYIAVDQEEISKEEMRTQEEGETTDNRRQDENKKAKGNRRGEKIYKQIIQDQNT